MQIEVPLHVAEVSCVRLYRSATNLMVRLYCRQCSNCPLAGCSSACLEGRLAQLFRQARPVFDLPLRQPGRLQRRHWHQAAWISRPHYVARSDLGAVEWNTGTMPPRTDRNRRRSLASEPPWHWHLVLLAKAYRIWHAGTKLSSKLQTVSTTASSMISTAFMISHGICH